MEVGYLPVDMKGTNYVKLEWFPGYIQNKHDKHLFSHLTRLKVPQTRENLTKTCHWRHHLTVLTKYCSELLPPIGNQYKQNKKGLVDLLTNMSIWSHPLLL